MIKKIKKNLRDYINKNYPDWDITIALRYLPIVEDLKKIHRAGETILEVGSEITGITTYLKKPVVGVDTNFDYTKTNKYLKPIKGSVLNLPFKDNSFDFVISVDMLEHIPPKFRQKAIEEMVRVAQKKIYLSFPCGEKAQLVDKHVQTFYVKKHGVEYAYLKEHLEYGLPDFNQVLNKLKKIRQTKTVVHKNTNIHLWKTLIKWGLSGDKFKSRLYRRSLLLLPLLKHFNFGETYRKLFILEFL